MTEQRTDRAVRDVLIVGGGGPVTVVRVDSLPVPHADSLRIRPFTNGQAISFPFEGTTSPSRWGN